MKKLCDKKANELHIHDIILINDNFCSIYILTKFVNNENKQTKYYITGNNLEKTNENYELELDEDETVEYFGHLNNKPCSKKHSSLTEQVKEHQEKKITPNNNKIIVQDEELELLYDFLKSMMNN